MEFLSNRISVIASARIATDIHILHCTSNAFDQQLRPESNRVEKVTDAYDHGG